MRTGSAKIWRILTANLKSVMLAVLLAVYLKENDRGLAERLKRREPRAMTELYDFYGRLVYSLIYRIVRDVGIAEDLVH